MKLKSWCDVDDELVCKIKPTNCDDMNKRNSFYVKKKNINKNAVGYEKQHFVLL